MASFIAGGRQAWIDMHYHFLPPPRRSLNFSPLFSNGAALQAPPYTVGHLNPPGNNDRLFLSTPSSGRIDHHLGDLPLRRSTMETKGGILHKQRDHTPKVSSGLEFTLLRTIGLELGLNLVGLSLSLSSLRVFSDLVPDKSSIYKEFMGQAISTGESKAKHVKCMSIDSASKFEDAPLNKGSRPSSGRCPQTNLTMDELIAAFQIREKQLLSGKFHIYMKEKFEKLLLGEDMSGGGKGVSSALALSNAITNLAASVFGEQSRLEPMTPDRKARWRKEIIDWLLSVADHVVELVPSQQKSKDGTNMEIMVTKQRINLHMNIPALWKLDAMLIDQNEFYYLSKDAPDSEKGKNKRKDDKWWLPTVKVPQDGLSDKCRKNLQSQKESVTQVLKAAMSINAQVLSEMEVPENYIEALPKNGRASLGDAVYRSITVEFFDPDQFFSTLDLSSELKILDLKNRLEASIVIWKRKMTQKDGKTTWGSAVSFE
ncbi:Rop guanine nucleotide exchange factor 11 [Hibiscus syriacus]|uniref:Rop guanine nucleotide exchange factor 11 n=1 Tax=Hibiscus syriacus TaxID=106335 RepID=A0A6A3A8C0_HIBSY|nr:Rop guanine nucleotide exchange factor 11 [Hibiscus syriacus]